MVIGPERAELPAAMGPPSIVVGRVLARCDVQILPGRGTLLRPQVAGVRRSWCGVTLCSVPSPRFREESGVRGEGGSLAAWRPAPTP